MCDYTFRLTLPRSDPQHGEVVSTALHLRERWEYTVPGRVRRFAGYGVSPRGHAFVVEWTQRGTVEAWAVPTLARALVEFTASVQQVRASDGRGPVRPAPAPKPPWRVRLREWWHDV